MKLRFAFLLALLAALPPARAVAHLALRSPPSRYGDFVLKEGPCGVSGGERSSNVTVWAPGSSVRIVWDEYVDHPGHFRVAFDADGDDDFVDPACLGGCAGRAPEIELYSNAAVLLDGIADTRGGESGVTVQLPDIECQRCTLQVIQVMYDKPPYVTPGNDIYYQCADLVLRAAAATATPVPSPPTPTPLCRPSDPFTCLCAGDCNGDGSVSVSELIVVINIALRRTPRTTCAAGDRDGDGSVEVGEIVAAVRSSLLGCPIVRP